MRIRSAMRERDQRYLLKGLVEMDEAYLGAPKRGQKRGRGTERGKMAIAVSKDGKGRPQFLHLQTIPDITTATLQSVVDGHVEAGSAIECDGLRSYAGLKNVTVNAAKYETGDLVWVHTVIGNFKAFLLGTYHGSCGNYQPYLDEFCFRFNRRFHPHTALFAAFKSCCYILCYAESSRYAYKLIIKTRIILCVYI